MIDLPPLQSPPQTDTVEQLAAAIADVLAHVYLYASTELEKHPENPAADELLNKLFDAIGYADDVAKKTSGPTVREVLGDPWPLRPPRESLRLPWRRVIR
jgi:hypothetical protein